LEEFAVESRVVAFTALMSGLAFALGVLSFPFILGLRIHFFQVAVFLCASAAGPIPGLICGAVGGSYTAFLRADPTILAGNALLGLATGLLALRLRPAFAALTAWFAVHAPWVFLVGSFVMGVPGPVIQSILVLLTVENIFSAAVADVVLLRLGVRMRLFRGAAPSLSDDLDLAKRTLHTHDSSIVFVKNGAVVFENKTRGIAGYVEAIEAAGEALRGVVLADRVAGRAAALLTLYAGGVAVYADIMSEGAVEIFQRHNIPFKYGERVPKILDKHMEGQCPFERAVQDVHDPEEAFTRLVHQVRLSR